MTKKALFYDPYLETVGGGERYTFTLADYLIKNGWQVDIVNGNDVFVEKILSRFNLDLRKVNFVKTSRQLLNKIRFERSYNLIFWVSDGSVPYLFGKNNILHQQVPFHGVNGGSLSNKIKLSRVNYVVCNSQFTKKFIDKEYGVISKVINPPVDTTSFIPGRKENIILTAGRFSKLLQAKRQDVLVETFKKMVDGGLKDWKFILVGSTDVGGREYLEELKTIAKSYPIEFVDNCPFETIKNLYSKAKIFWYAGGYGVDENEEPEKVEHFGITLVEAMAAGCVPIVVEKGGLKEIVTGDKSGFFWKTEEDLILITNALIQNDKQMGTISNEAKTESKKYGIDRFCEEFSKLIL